MKVGVNVTCDYWNWKDVVPEEPLEFGVEMVETAVVEAAGTMQWKGRCLRPRRPSGAWADA